MVRGKEVSPSELVGLYLERIAAIDPKLNSYRVVLAEGARADARRAEDRLAKGDAAPLLGVPVAIKDNVDYAGEVTTDGTAAYGEPATEDGLVVRRLREAGAVILGKTNLPELAIYGFTESPAWGASRNPWDTSLTTGGAGGGRGAAGGVGPLTNPLGPSTDARRCGHAQRRPRRSGPVRDRPRDRRRRLDPLPGALLWAVQTEAATESHLDVARPRALVRPVGLRLRQPHREGHRALPGRDERARE